jgi:hypothetical protein
MKNIKEYIKVSEAYCKHQDELRMAVVRAINAQHKILRDHKLNPDDYDYEHEGVWARDGEIVDSDYRGVRVSMGPLFDSEGDSNFTCWAFIPALCLAEDTYFDAIDDITKPLIAKIIENNNMIEVNSKESRRKHYERLKIEFEGEEK